MKRYLAFIIFCFLFAKVVSGQNDSIFNDTTQDKGFSIGTRHAGLGFGSLGHYSGIKFSIKENDSIINGLNFNLWGSRDSYPNKAQIKGVQAALVTEAEIINGVCFNIFYADVTRINGIEINGCFGAHDFSSGLNLTGLGFYCYQFKGISVTGIAQGFDWFSGIAISPINISSESRGVLVGAFNFSAEHKGAILGFVNAARRDFKSISVNGLVFGGINFVSGLNGIQIGLLNLPYFERGFGKEINNGLQVGLINYGRMRKGIQIGFLNINPEKKHFKVMPFVNYHLEKW